MQRSPLALLSFVAAGLFLAGGCGPGSEIPANYKTTVEVTYKGAPVDGAIVTLRADGHQAPTATGVTGADGKVNLFSFKGKGQGVVPGKYKVGIEKQKVEAPPSVDVNSPDYGKAEEKPAERVDLLPSKYISASDSGLTCTVTDDPTKNVFKFDLTD